MSSNKEIYFNREAVELCKEVWRCNVATMTIARELKQVLIMNSVINDDDTYEKINGNIPFKSNLSKYIAAGLSEDPRRSLYGRGLISDFTLYHFCNTDAEFNYLIFYNI